MTEISLRHNQQASGLGVGPPEQLQVWFCRNHSSRYLMVGTCSQASSSANEGSRFSIFLCGGISALLNTFTTSDTLYKDTQS